MLSKSWLSPTCTRSHLDNYQIYGSKELSHTLFLIYPVVFSNLSNALRKQMLFSTIFLRNLPRDPQRQAAQKRRREYQSRKSDATEPLFFQAVLLLMLLQC
jgi:hypothetical protein